MINEKGYVNQLGYFAKDVATDLNITTSTLRRWSLELEKQGYVFERNEKDQRIYFARDFKAFRELQKLLGNSTSLADAAKSVAAMEFEDESPVFPNTLHLSEPQLRRIINEEVKAAVQEEREVMFQAFEEKLEDIVERRDRYLMHEIRKEKEQKLLETAATSETHRVKKRPFWRRWFSSE
jgi:DNA-binding transcriptional MerR regulator